MSIPLSPIPSCLSHSTLKLDKIERRKKIHNPCPASCTFHYYRPASCMHHTTVQLPVRIILLSSFLYASYCCPASCTHHITVQLPVRIILLSSFLYASHSCPASCTHHTTVQLPVCISQHQEDPAGCAFSPPTSAAPRWSQWLETARLGVKCLL